MFVFQVMPFLLRRTKDDVLADLPPKIIQDRYCDLSPVQLLLYEKFSHSQVKSEVANIVHETGISGDLEKPSSRQPTHVFQVFS
jgi:TATA-binding protein-associated factor